MPLEDHGLRPSPQDEPGAPLAGVMMSFPSWRRWLDRRSLPPQGQRPIRRRLAARSWEECETRALLSMTVGDVTMVEPGSGTADAVFTVKLDQAHNNEPVQVDFATEDATAKA